MSWYAPHEGRPGRSRVFSVAAIQFCLSIKVLFKLPLWQSEPSIAFACSFMNRFKALGTAEIVRGA